MRFADIPSRSNWRDRAAELGYFTTVLESNSYWIETLPEPFCVILSPEETAELEVATSELTRLALKVVDKVCSSSSDEYFEKLCIAPIFRAAIRESWRRADPALYGRFDFAFNGKQLKLLELNFDTPTSLYEAAVFQWLWLEDHLESARFPDNVDQFNTINERLIQWFGAHRPEGTMHFASMANCREDEDTVKYMQSCATLAGVAGKFMYMTDIGVDENGRWFDLDEQPIQTLFKLYPWEFMFEEDQKMVRQSSQQGGLCDLVQKNLIHFVEPCWKSILSNKAVLPLLWQEAPGHKYLAESVYEDTSEAASRMQRRRHARKPIFGREGDSVSLIDPDNAENSLLKTGIYGAEGFVLQELCTLPSYRDFHLVTGSWVVGNEPAGVGFRADRSRVTSNTAHFVPHCILEDSVEVVFDLKVADQQQALALCQEQS